MKKETTLDVALVNIGGRDGSTEFKRAAAADLPKGCFHQRRWPKGTVIAALDWNIVLNDAASLLAIGSFLWASYKRFSKTRNPHAGIHGILVNLRDDKGVCDTFVIGREVQDWQTLTKRLSENADRLRQKESQHGVGK